MFDEKEPKMNEDFYTNNLGPEQEEFLRRKKNNDLRNAFKGGWGSSVSKQIQDVNVVEEKLDTRSNLNMSNGEDEEIRVEDKSEGFIYQVEEFLELAQAEKISSNDFNGEDKSLLKNSKEGNSDIEDVIAKLIPLDAPLNAAINIVETENNLEVEEVSKVYFSESDSKNIDADEDNYIDIIEISKIYYYAEMLDKFIGQEANQYEFLEDKPFIDILKNELEKILKKEQYKKLNLLYSTSLLGSKYSVIMSELHKNKYFIKYMKKQSKFFLNETPERVNQLNWFPLYKANYENKSWLQPVKYAEEANETLTPWTRTGLLVWFIGLIIAGGASYFNSLKETAGLIEIYSPLIIIGVMLTLVTVVDFIGAWYLRIKYKKLENTLLEIKNSVNEVIIGKEDINPLMHDVCSYYVKITK